MALYDGFFDAERDENGEYDREYEATDFTDYFAQIIGSGVCVHNAPDSFRVRMEDRKAIISPGYLFIQGYWCKNDADYTINLPGAGNYAILAHLNLGKRMIELSAESVAQAYPDSLVLAIVSPTSAEDTRYNTDLCGVIDTAGELSVKVEWAINYIDNEIESKLQAVEQDINAQSAKLDAKIAEVQAVVDRISPPPVGSIKFSASKDVGEEWLQCDGRFVNEQDYPELVEALGKLIPSGDKFQLLSDGKIGPQISNGVVYDKRLWVYSYSTQKLYGVDLEGGSVKEITVTSDDPDFFRVHIPSTSQPIALSIVKSPIDGKTTVFLAQILTSGKGLTSSSAATELKDCLWIYSGEFAQDKDNISVSAPFTQLTDISRFHYFYSATCVPYVISYNAVGVETFLIVTGFSDDITVYTLEWKAETNSAKSVQRSVTIFGSVGSVTGYYFNKAQRLAFNSRNKDEVVMVYTYSKSGPMTYCTSIGSYNNGAFSRGEYSTISEIPVSEVLGTPTPLNIVGEEKMLFEPSRTSALVVSLKNLDVPQKVDFGISLPSAARVFVDGGAYLWGKDIYMLFVGTGIVFSRTLESGDFGYLDTTSVLGTITQFGWLGYSQDEGTLYLLGQDTNNSVKVAKIVLNTLYDYANDGAWLPIIASDGVPAYIKAYEPGSGDGGSIPDPVDIKVKVTFERSFLNYAELLFNGEVLPTAMEYTRSVSAGGNFTVAVKTNGTITNSVQASMNGTSIINVPMTSGVGTTQTKSFKSSDYLSSGITLVCSAY